MGSRTKVMARATANNEKAGMVNRKLPSNPQEVIPSTNGKAVGESYVSRWSERVDPFDMIHQ